MPLNSGGIKIPVDMETQDVIRESNKVIAQLDRVGAATKANNAAMLKSAQQAEQAAKKSSMSWTDFRSMYSTVLDVVRVGQQVWDGTVNKFVEYTDKVRDTSRALGTTAEEAARLIQVGDDVFISYDKMTAAMKMAQKDGFEPTIDGLAKMADEYVALAPGVERTQYLLDRFGKSGGEMGKLLEKGGAGVRSMSDAIDDSLIPTQEAIDQAEKYKIAQDALNETWEAFTYQVAPPLMNAATDLINKQLDQARAQEILSEKGMVLKFASAEVREAALEQARAEREEAEAARLAGDTANDTGTAFEGEAEKAKILEDQAKLLADALGKVTDKNKDMLGLTMNLQSEMSGYNEKLAETIKNYGEASDEVQELKKKHEDAMKKIVFDLYIAKLQADGFSGAEYEMAIQSGVALGIIDQSTADMALALDKVTSAAANTKGQILDIGTVANAIAGEYNIHFNVTTNGGFNPIGGSALNYTQYASGGEFIIPPSYGPEGFKLGNMGTASGGEKVTITTPGSNSGGIDYNRLARTLVAALATAGE